MVDLREPLDSLIAPSVPLHVGHRLPARRRRSASTTPRCATASRRPGVAFTPDQKYELAGMLSDAGVHIIDMGFPSAAPSERRALELILEGKKKGRIRPDLEIIVMCRSNARRHRRHARHAREDGREAVRLHVLHLHVRLGPAPQVQDRQDAAAARGTARPRSGWTCRSRSIARPTSAWRATAIAHARSRGVEQIEFGGEDGSRADVDYLIELADACYAAGGTRYSFPDTVGFFAPEGVDYYIPKLVAAFPDKPLVVHFHNDFGLGAYNTVRALHHGATIPTCTVNGIGERAGNAPLHTTVMILKELYGITIPGFRYDMLWALRRKVEEYSGLPVGASEPDHRPQRLQPRDRHPHRRHDHPSRDLPGDRAGDRGRPAALPVRQALGRDGDRGGAAAPPARS